MPNALADEKSPYLLQHADNPVEWLPWGEAAFAKARAEGKPIFLSIGYSTCHWCHVMAHESFENADVAALLNAHFVPIKVDREERPDVDRVYMTYVQARIGHGGWPLSVWLTPELKPFHGGTYFPPEDRQGRVGLPSVLQAIARAWTEERDKLVEEAERVLGSLNDFYAERRAQRTGPAAAQPLHEAAGDAFERCYLHLYESFDPAKGGFGGAPKFPRAANLDFLFRVALLQGAESEAGREAAQMAATTLQKMTMGGLHDHVGGGFHRYSVDDAWFVPHFEKMLYDQAQIAGNLLDAHLHTGDERHAWTARAVFDYSLRELAHPRGGFFSAEDADSKLAHDGDAHAEGAYYLWTHAELVASFGDDAAWICDHFGATPEGNGPAELDPHGGFAGKNLLHQKRPLAETAAAHGLEPAVAVERLATALDRLRVRRAWRPRPHLDDKVIAAWNGLMISALARGAMSGAGCLADKREFYREAAVRAARFVETELYDDGRGVLFRAWREGRGANEGFAEDYAYLIAALLDLHEATFGVRWLRWAERLQRTMDALLWDDEDGGYFNSRADDAGVILRLKEDYDGAAPAASSVAVANLTRLAAALNDADLRSRALRTVEAFRPQWANAPHAMPAMLCAVERVLAEPRHVVLVGDIGSPAFQALAEVVWAERARQWTVIALDAADGEGRAWLGERAPWLAEMRAPDDGSALAYVCHGYTCRAPVATAPELRREMKTES